jgi:hypothetical protein
MSDKRVWTKDEILARIAADPRWVERGILALYRRQTRDERRDGITRYDNDLGFCGFDARAGSSYARLIEGSRQPTGQRLFGRKLTSARRICAKHVGQLVAEANGTRVEL